MTWTSSSWLKLSWNVCGCWFIMKISLRDDDSVAFHAFTHSVAAIRWDMFLCCRCVGRRVEQNFLRLGETLHGDKRQTFNFTMNWVGKQSTRRSENYLKISLPRVVSENFFSHCVGWWLCFFSRPIGLAGFLRDVDKVCRKTRKWEERKTLSPSFSPWKQQQLINKNKKTEQKSLSGISCGWYARYVRGRIFHSSIILLLVIQSEEKGGKTSNFAKRDFQSLISLSSPREEIKKMKMGKCQIELISRREIWNMCGISN